MSTNYYALVKPDEMPHCATCSCPGREKGRIHIGKASGGYRFAYHATEFKGTVLDSHQRWADFLARRDVAIVAEGGEYVGLDEFLAMVERKQEDQMPTLPTMRDRSFVDEQGYRFLRAEFC